MSEIAEELMRRSSPAYMKDRAREAVVRKTYETKEKVKDSPMAWKLLGGALGVGLASLLSKKYQERREVIRYDDLQRGWVGIEAAPRVGVVVEEYDYEPLDTAIDSSRYAADGVQYSSGIDSSERSGPGIKAKASRKASDLKDRATGAVSSAREELSEKASDLREGISQRASDVREGIHEKADAVREGLQEKAGAVREGISDKAAQVKGRASELRETAKERLSGVKSGASEKLHHAGDVTPSGWATSSPRRATASIT